MYNSLSRRRGSKQSADTRARQVLDDPREGKPAEFLRCHECEAAIAAQGRKKQRQAFAAKLLPRVADPRNLYLAVEHIATEGGSASGPNGLRADDLSRSEQWGLTRALSKAIRSGSYRPGPHREVKIPKASGHGERTLQIQNIEDRTVQRAVLQILQPFVDPSFQAGSLGYRPRKGRDHALAKAETLAVSTGHWTWITEDVADAFDHVPLKRLMDIVRKHVPDDDFLTLIDNVIMNDKGKGLRQGGALSPLLLNLFLDRVLDRPWKKFHPDTPLVRVADDLLLLCADDEHARDHRKALTDMLRSAGLKLKEGKGALRDLSEGQPIEWLGLELRKGNDGLEARIDPRSWSQLNEALRGAHDKPHAPIRAQETITGWIGSLGPCYPHHDVNEVHEGIRRLALEYAFEEVPPVGALRLLWERAFERWERLRKADDGDDRADEDSAAPPAHFFLAEDGSQGGALTPSALPFPISPEPATALALVPASRGPNLQRTDPGDVHSSEDASGLECTPPTVASSAPTTIDESLNKRNLTMRNDRARDVAPAYRKPREKKGDKRRPGITTVPSANGVEKPRGGNDRSTPAGHIRSSPSPSSGRTRGKKPERADHRVQPAPAVNRNKARQTRSPTPVDTQKPSADGSSLASISELDTVASDIRLSLALFQMEIRTSLRHAAEVGELLFRAKKLVKHGAWKRWLEENCPEVSHRTANDYMRVAEHKNLLFDVADDDSNSQFTANLTIAAFLKMVSKPRAKRGERATKTTSSKATEKDNRGCHDKECDDDRHHGAGDGSAEEDEADPSSASERAASTSSSSDGCSHETTALTIESTTLSTPDRCATQSAEACVSLRTASADDPDDETAWLTSLPIRERLADPAVFDTEALSWLKAQPLVKALRDVCAALGLTAEDYAKSRLGPSCRQRYSRHLACTVGVKPPGEWTVCRECRGTGKSKSRTECNLCAGGGYVITHAGDVVFDEEEE